MEEMRHSTSAILTQKGLEGIQVVVWPRDTKLVLSVLGVRGGDRGRILGQLVVLI